MIKALTTGAGTENGLSSFQLFLCGLAARTYAKHVYFSPFWSNLVHFRPFSRIQSIGPLRYSCICFDGVYEYSNGVNKYVALVSVVVGKILKKVTILAGKQIGLAWGFKDELTRLRDSLTTIQAVLDDVERRQEGEEFVRLWLQRLNDAAFDVNGVLDDLAYEILCRKVEI
ncbi:hypothetical protein SO802_022402 [Lithocarpus litseifolius]|uniref:Disease resistance N-terminal domain-containing protein n=1 Tax=Lithocarpus litseifolius TaxID=425828 RepID=A0AAW2CHY5_9ROSI